MKEEKKKERREKKMADIRCNGTAKEHTVYNGKEGGGDKATAKSRR
jgi:hypothetical protein